MTQICLSDVHCLTLFEANKTSFMFAFYPSLTYTGFMEFIEAPVFTKNIYAYMSDDDYADLQLYLFRHPESGDLIPGSGGIRKLRWVLPEKNKGD